MQTFIDEDIHWLKRSLMQKHAEALIQKFIDADIHWWRHSLMHTFIDAHIHWLKNSLMQKHCRHSIIFINKIFINLDIHWCMQLPMWTFMNLLMSIPINESINECIDECLLQWMCSLMNICICISMEEASVCTDQSDQAIKKIRQIFSMNSPKSCQAKKRPKYLQQSLICKPKTSTSNHF